MCDRKQPLKGQHKTVVIALLLLIPVCVLYLLLLNVMGVLEGSFPEGFSYACWVSLSNFVCSVD